MVENQINCSSPATNCESVNISEGAMVIPSAEDSTKAYVNDLLNEIKTLENDLKNTTENQTRFQELYQVCLGAIYKCLESNSIDNLKDVITKLGEIEARYCKA